MLELNEWDLPLLPMCVRQARINVALRVCQKMHFFDILFYLCTIRGVPQESFKL